MQNANKQTKMFGIVSDCEKLWNLCFYTQFFMCYRNKCTKWARHKYELSKVQGSTNNFIPKKLPFSLQWWIPIDCCGFVNRNIYANLGIIVKLNNPCSLIHYNWSLFFQFLVEMFKITSQSHFRRHFFFFRLWRINRKPIMCKRE